MVSNKFTVLIPTRERAETLYYAIKTCVAQEYDNLKIIISDNASQDNTREIVESFKDSRIIYLNTGKRVSMVKNFDFAYEQVKDGYVISMGDDDGLTLDSVNTANDLLNEHYKDAVLSNLAVYHWPNHPNLNADRLFFSTKKGYEIRHTKDYIYKSFYGTYHYNQLPCLYYGFIKATVFNEIKRRFNGFFLTNQVDLFSSIALSQRIDSFIYSYAPLAIAGVSGRSNGTSIMYENSDKTEKKLWEAETDLVPDPPFKTIPNVKILMAEAYHKLEKEHPDFIKYKVDMKKLLNTAITEASEKKNLDKTSADITGIVKYFGYDLKIASKNLFLWKIKKKFSDFLSFQSNILLEANAYQVADVYTAAIFISLYKKSKKYRTKLFNKMAEKLR